MKKVALLVALMAVGVIIFAAVPSGAAPTSVIVFNGQAHLNSGFPCTGACSGTFTGTARGVALNPTTNCVAGCAMNATFNYAEPGGQCVAGTVAAAALGTANGSYTVTAPTGSISGNFSWTRVGITAVMLLNSPLGAGVSAFIPPASCAPNNATVAGVAATV